MGGVLNGTAFERLKLYRSSRQTLKTQPNSTCIVCTAFRWQRCTPNLDPPRSTRGGPFLLIVCVRSHRCTGFKKRDTTEAALLARAASGLSLVADERGGLISSRTARGVRMNLVLAMVFQRHVRRKAVLFPATRAQAAEAGLLLHKLASSWLRGEVSMDSYSTRRLTSAMNNMCSALVTSAARCPRMALPIAPYADRGCRTRGKVAKS